MEGTNRFLLNKATVMEAIEAYLNKERVKKDLTVTDFKSNVLDTEFNEEGHVTNG